MDHSLVHSNTRHTNVSWSPLVEKKVSSTIVCSLLFVFFRKTEPCSVKGYLLGRHPWMSFIIVLTLVPSSCLPVFTASLCTEGQTLLHLIVGSLYTSYVQPIFRWSSVFLHPFPALWSQFLLQLFLTQRPDADSKVSNWESSGVTSSSYLFYFKRTKVGFSEGKLSNVSVITLVFILLGWENFHIGAYIFSFCFSWLINRNVLLINFDHRHQSQAKGIKSVYADFELLFCKQWDKK